MKPRYLLDTNICIYLMKRQPPEVAARLEDCFVGDVAMSAVTLAELEFGVECSGAAREHFAAALEGLLEDIPAVPFDAVAARHYGVLRAAVRERSRAALDRLIAAHAVALGATLVTNDERDFGGYPGLRVENWARQ